MVCAESGDGLSGRCHNGRMESAPAGGRAEAHRFGVRCTRCGRTQPPDRLPTVARWPYCGYCAAPLSVQRWVATPPPGMGPAPRVRRVVVPYAGPPRYGPVHPGWGFPPVARLRTHDLPPDSATERRLRAARLGPRFSVAISLALAAFLTCCAAAAAEAWRFALLLRGRTEVLPARLVRRSDAAVAVASSAALLIVAAAVLAGTGAAAACYRAAAARAGVRPARNSGQIAARLLVPGWNLYGAGQVAVELMRLVFRPVRGIGRPAPRWMRRVVAGYWAAWAGSGALATLLVILALLPALPWGIEYSNQTAANLVEAHILLDLMAGLAALLGAVMLAALRNEWFGGRPGRPRHWAVAQPTSTARNRRDPVPAARGRPGSADL